MPASPKLKWPPIEGGVGLFQTIDRYVSAVDPMGAWRRQKSDDVGHLLGGPQTAHRKTVADIVIKIFLVGEAVAVPPVPFDQYRARRDRCSPGCRRARIPAPTARYRRSAPPWPRRIDPTSRAAATNRRSMRC